MLYYSNLTILPGFSVRFRRWADDDLKLVANTHPHTHTHTRSLYISDSTELAAETRRVRIYVTRYIRLTVRGFRMRASVSYPSDYVHECMYVQTSSVALGLFRICAHVDNVGDFVRGCRLRGVRTTQSVRDAVAASERWWV